MTQNTLDKIIDSVRRGEDTYSLESFGKMFALRKNGVTLKLIVNEEEAHEVFSRYKKPMPKGGETIMPTEKKEEVTQEDFIDDREDIASDKGNEQKALVIAQAKNIQAIYGSKYANVGTEEVTQDDLNTPTLKLVQDNTKNLDNKKSGWFHRSDTGEQMETVDVNLVSVTTKESLNYNKTAMEKYKVYFGFYTDSKEPFKMYVRGTSLSSHRQLQSEILSYKNRYGVPMFSLTVRLSSRQETGKTKAGIDYDIRKTLFTVLKDKEDQSLPIIEEDPDRIGFLLEAADRFKALAETVKDEEAIPSGEPEY